ncbi:ABC transporter ATP-binding protein [Patulibacter defluvii]|uniref:ABC transporter ATP-binding protein n=1 Tax=Patulibacter defluvii TaxID=3095358 RepID=UPI002A7614EA|nr:ABC transporter ATP-binding protein [Patulibacter sp. DM4]
MLEVDDLRVRFPTARGLVRAVDGVSYRLDREETLAIVGESGSGKTVSAQAVVGLLDGTGAEVSGGVRFEDRDLLTLDPRERRSLAGSRIAMVFQDPLAALNPTFTVGAQIAEMFRVHRRTRKREAMRRAIELMDRVGIPLADERARHYPHQFSGGMRQRIVIAMAIALEPDVLIADEPTTALDVTVQAQILEVLADLQRETGMGLVLVTHDLGVVGEIADRVAVMYAGRIVETGTADELHHRPAHPYTRALIASQPRIGDRGRTLQAIGGAPPELIDPPAGCRFHPRCPLADDRCTAEVPEDRELDAGHRAACHHVDEVLADAVR